jgi:hypothetical protein
MKVRKGKLRAKKLDREYIPDIFCNYCTSIVSIKMPQYDLFQASIPIGMLQNMQATRVSSWLNENESLY